MNAYLVRIGIPLILSLAFSTASAEVPSSLSNIPTSSTGIPIGDVVTFQGVGQVFYAGRLASQEVFYAMEDAPKIYNWGEAMSLCSEMGPGWRLPTSAEMMLVYNNKPFVDLFALDMRPIASNFYWTSSEVDREKAIQMRLYDGHEKSTKKHFYANARCARAY